MKNITLVFLIILSATINQNSQKTGTSVIRLTADIDNVKISIPELKFKATKTEENTDWIMIDEVPEGDYGVKFSAFGVSISENFYIPENDTLSVVGSLRKGIIYGVLIDEYHRNVAYNDSVLNAREQERRKYSSDQSEVEIPNKEDIDPYKVEDEFEDEEIFYIVEQMPTFNHGDPAIEFRKYIAQNLRYPESAAVKGIQGRVIVQFAVDSHGQVCDVVTVVNVDPLLDKEAERVVKSSPLWQPGKQRGKAVKVLFTFPVSFKLS